MDLKAHDNIQANETSSGEMAVRDARRAGSSKGQSRGRSHDPKGRGGAGRDRLNADCVPSSVFWSLGNYGSECDRRKLINLSCGERNHKRFQALACNLNITLRWQGN